MKLSIKRWWGCFVGWLGKRSTLLLLLAINGPGTIYGYFWYRHQLASTEPWYLLPFVPDSPTASLFFCFVLALFLSNRRSPLIEAFACVTLVKYGLWATIMLIWTGALGGQLTAAHYMLILSHIGMALEAVLYIPYYRFKFIHLALVAFWVFSNDLLDYTVPIFPWLDKVLHPYLSLIFPLTVGLSVLSLLLFYVTVVKRGWDKKMV